MSLMPLNNEVVFTNGKFFTSNPDQPFADTMVVRDGRILSVGDLTAINVEGRKVIDLQGRRILPGLIDAHLHPLFLANASRQIACTPPNVYSIEDLVEKICKQIEAQDNSQWVEAWGYDEGKLSEGRAPTRWDLDQASTEVPIVVIRNCVHIISANSKALELAGITKDTPDPPGGKIDRDSKGEPTGVLRENARYLVLDIVPTPTIEENALALANLGQELFSKGITGITELLARKVPTNYMELYQKARNYGFKHRTALYVVAEDVSENRTFSKEDLDREKQIHVGGVKLLTDGSVSGQTAWVNPPFLGEEQNTGIQMISEVDLLVAADIAKKNNIQLVVHAMGEQAINFVLETLKNTENWLSDGPSIRIEHAAMPTEKAMKDAAKRGIAFVTQPIFLYAEIESYVKNLGAERTKETYPVRTMLEAGIQVAFSSDAPATAWADPANPFVGLKAAVTRFAYDGTDTGQKHKVDISTAISLYTRRAQEITRIPNVGQLTPGYHADFIVLNRDILEIPAEEIDQVEVEETYLGGELVYSKLRG